MINVLAKKRSVYKKSNLVAKLIALGCASCVLAGSVGLGVASAGGGVSHDVDSFGIAAAGAAASASMTTADFSEASSAHPSAADEPAMREAAVLSSTASRDISQGIDAIEAAEAEEEAARIAAAEKAKAEQREAEQRSSADAALAALPDVDFSVGEEAFLAEWTVRINAYLAGSALAGYGAVFAEAAWVNGVDPRWSPAISNTESSKGAHPYKPFNAWGWKTSDTWSSWEEAINAHVAGLAKGYGYTISVANAKKYCPPTYMEWFDKTIAQMRMI